MEGSQVYQDYDPGIHLQHDTASMQQQQILLQQSPQHQQGFIRWAAQPITAYQLVPMDYQPVYPHAHQHQLPQVQPHQHPTLYTFSQAAAVPQMTPMPPISPVTPVSPTYGPFINSSIRRQVSVNFRQMSPGQGAYFDLSPPQYQNQGASCRPQHQYPVQHTLHHSASTPIMVAHGPSGSPEMINALPFSPARRASQSFVPSMAFATPPPAPKKSFEDMNVFTNNNNVPTMATGSRLAPRRESTGMHRLRKPKSLVLSMPQARRAQQEKGYNGSPTGPKASAMSFPLDTVGGAHSVMSQGSDHEYDGGDSSYSTSPLGSETDAKMRRRFRMMSSVHSIPAYLQQSYDGAANEVPLSPTQRHKTLSFRERVAAHPSHIQSGGSLEKFLQDHIHSIGEQHAEENTTAECTADTAELPLSSSDEWYATTDTEPIRSRHRHRVAGIQGEADEASLGEGNFCNYGLQQCLRCGLFISRPETHTCLRKGA
ncbi:MAG: hypothetical protein SEPTF4163_001375 [Sporothrix epigloea]